MRFRGHDGRLARALTTLMMLVSVSSAQAAPAGPPTQSVTVSPPRETPQVVKMGQRSAGASQVATAVPTRPPRAANPGRRDTKRVTTAGARSGTRTPVAAPGPDRRAPASVTPSRTVPSKTEAPPLIDTLGPLSVGHPHAGYLVNGVAMPRANEWVLTVPAHGFATHETIEQLSACIRDVTQRFPRTPPVMLGSLSARQGGPLPPHKSHRTGRDVDYYFYRKPDAKWYQAATEADIDLPRTWAAIRCLVTTADTDFILIDQRPKAWLERHALEIGEDPAWVHDLFHDTTPYRRAHIKHVPGHVAHMHVRFVSPKARAGARAAYDRLVSAGVVTPPVREVRHAIVRGDTLSQIAQRYHTTVAALVEKNHLPSTTLYVGKTLLITEPVDIRDARAPVVVPPRRMPPPPSAPEQLSATRVPAR